MRRRLAAEEKGAAKPRAAAHGCQPLRPDSQPRPLCCSATASACCCLLASSPAPLFLLRLSRGRRGARDVCLTERGSLLPSSLFCSFSQEKALRRRCGRRASPLQNARETADRTRTRGTVTGDHGQIGTSFFPCAAAAPSAVDRRAVRGARHPALPYCVSSAAAAALCGNGSDSGRKGEREENRKTRPKFGGGVPLLSFPFRSLLSRASLALALP